jgi:hypothetical protein
METTNYKIVGTRQNGKTRASRILQIVVEVGLYIIRKSQILYEILHNVA